MHLLESYLRHVRHLSRRLERHPGALQELLRMIECSKDEAYQHPSLEPFFKGEYSFYNGQYDRSLKYYLEAKEVENFEFYCYRSSAYLSKGQHQSDKAIIFARRALRIDPEDFASIVLLRDVYNESGRLQEAEEMAAKAEALADASCSETNEYQDIQPIIPFGKEKIEELAGIFAVAKKEEPLFDAEQTSAPITKEKAAIIHSFADYKLISNNDVKKPQDIETAINAFRGLQSRILTKYLEKGKKGRYVQDNSLCILHGWKTFSKGTSKNTEDLSFLASQSLSASGGYYFRWNQKGIVVNPGKNFLDHFHFAGLHLNAIDFVISTNPEPDSYADLKDLADLNAQLNCISGEKHQIHFYLQEQIYKQILEQINSPYSVVHCLNFSECSGEGKKIDLDPLIRLICIADSSDTISWSLKFYDSQQLHQTSCHVGSISYAQRHSSHVETCDILLVSMKDVNIENDIAFEEKSSSFPKLILFTEFDGKDGDIRLEYVRRVRHGQSTHYLPTDLGLMIDLKRMQIKCTLTGIYFDLHDVRVVRSNGLFSPLLYLSPSCIL